MVPIEVTAKNATGGTTAPLPGSAGTVSRNASPQLPSTAITGTPLALTRLQSWWPGMARSRENAKKVREQLVTQAIPQKNWPTHAMKMMASAQFWFMSADVKTEIELPAASLIAFVSVAAKVIASSTNQPMIAEMKTDCHTPLAAACSASVVSSATCADAS